jgi:hypothetical protein
MPNAKRFAESNSGIRDARLEGRRAELRSCERPEVFFVEVRPDENAVADENVVRRFSATQRDAAATEHGEHLPPRQVRFGHGRQPTRPIHGEEFAQIRISLLSISRWHRTFLLESIPLARFDS